MFVWSVFYSVVIMKVLIIESLACAWNPETEDYSGYVKTSTGYANAYMYGMGLIPLSDITKPFEDYSVLFQTIVIVVHILQKYQTLILSFSNIFGLTGTYAARQIAITTAGSEVIPYLCFTGVFLS